MVTYIYTLKDPINNEIRYVGKANNPKVRLRNHLNISKKDQIYKRNWILKLRKLEVKPIMEVIDTVPIDEWEFWEKYWISQMKTWGFKLINYTSGGDGCSFENQTSFKKGQNGKKVVGLNKDYEIVYEFDTCTEAAEFLNVSRGTISGCCNQNNRIKTVKKIAWLYKEHLEELSKDDIKKIIDDKFDISRKKNSGSFKKGQNGDKSKSVLMFDLDWNFIREFSSAKEAGEYLNVTGGAIQHACLVSKKNKCKNFKFKYK
jgi:hypothetical protein